MVTPNLPVGIADVYAARERLRSVATVTPVRADRTLDAVCGAPVWCKAESLQQAGSFKFRGAYNAVAALPEERRGRGVIGASSGNHAKALALAGCLWQVPVTVVVPRDAPAIKIEVARTLGARIVGYDPLREDRDRLTADLAAAHGLTVVPSADHRDVVAGAATVALEFLAQAPDLTVLLVPVGGGGLAAGTALTVAELAAHVRVVGVEPETAADTTLSLRAGRRIALPTVPDTIADGLRHRVPAELPWRINRRLLGAVVTVTEDEIRAAMGWALRCLDLVVEPSGAVALAAAPRFGAANASVGVVVSGGSVDAAAFTRLVAPGWSPAPGR
ncbi:threonine ammonia-lyase [Nocardia thailandica]|uniref:threonine ammonia-lyase n=1 Tax=Nocardia thailandica TaxID=257275 RepID=UPI0002EF24C9|nr:threonine/serine dehydratase [Nocardia thailandica]